jgi:methylmalonyl-CoA mutase N-terminal domain/subunit
MSDPEVKQELKASARAGIEEAKARWEREFEAQVGADRARVNRSGLVTKPLYGPEDWDSSRYLEDLGFPGQGPCTRGIHASMHRGRPWTPRLVVGLGVPQDYNKRMRDLYAIGLNGLFLAPCNSHMRGYDSDEVDRELLGTCGTLISTSDDMAVCLDGIPFDKESISMGDTAPYTLTAMLLKVAKDRSILWKSLVGTTNQSDYLSHYAALHMFYRLSLPGQKRVLLDHIDWMMQNVPRWNPLSIVGQHMQQAGATPAQAMGLTISSAIQYANDLVARGREADSFLPRFSFFFDISISFFEEIAKFRAGRRIWDRITKERFGAQDPRSRRFRFHAQTSGVDLTRQQPLNNIARVTIQAIAAIFGGLQSLHTNSYDEAIGSPTERTARVAVATQNILRAEAHLDDVIDPLGGSYYVEAVTNQMEEEILSVIRAIDEQGGMYAAVQTGFVQAMIGKSALEFQKKIENKEQLVVGLNEYTCEQDSGERPPMQERLSSAKIDAYLADLKNFRAKRGNHRVEQALDDLARAFDSETVNAYGMIVKAIEVGATHGEVCERTRTAVGFGAPLVVV